VNPWFSIRGVSTALSVGSIAILASEDLRILRVKVRSGLSEDQIRERMTSQVTDDVRKARATYIIENEGTFETVRERTKAILNQIGGLQ